MTGQSPLSTLNNALLSLIGLLSLTYAGHGVAQGQDTTPWSRDLQVIEVMLPGFYSNANQAYFDGRRKVDNPQSRHNLLIEAADTGFDVTLSAPDGTVISSQRWSLAEDDQREAVRMDISDADGTPSALFGGAGTPHNLALMARQSALRVWPALRRWPWVSSSSGGPRAAAQRRR